MKIDRKALKWAAKQKLREHKPSPLKVTLVFLLLTAGISTIVQLVAMNPIQLVQSALSAFDTGYSYSEVFSAMIDAQESRSVLFYPLNLLITFYSWVVAFGFASFNLNRTRNLEAGYDSLISVFSRSGKVMLMNLIVMGFTFCWYIMVMVPVVVFTGVVIGVLSIVAVGGVPNSVILIEVMVLIFVAVVVAILALAFITARYAQTDYVLLDNPELGALDAVRYSRNVMTGRALEYVKLRLSFLGWEFLVGLVAALVFLVVWTVSLVVIQASGGDVTNGTSITIGMFAAYGSSFLAALPLTLWVTAYTHGTLAEYYCAITATTPVPVQPSGTWNTTPGPDHTKNQGPDLF